MQKQKTNPLSPGTFVEETKIRNILQVRYCTSVVVLAAPPNTVLAARRDSSPAAKPSRRAAENQVNVKSYYVNFEYSSTVLIAKSRQQHK